MAAIMVATERGLKVAGQSNDLLGGADVTALVNGRAGMWALVRHQEIFRIARGVAEHVATLDGPRAWCLVEYSGVLFIGTDDSGLFKLEGGTLVRVAGFDEAPGRSEWFQPPGRRPATTWALACGAGQLFVNVHVGGILRSRDGGASFTQTIDVDLDVHEVQLGSDRRLWAATGKNGLAESRDAGVNWTFHSAGLPAKYLTCVAPVEDGVLVAAASGFGSGDDAVYRFDGKKFQRCSYGLPEKLGHLNARQLTAQGKRAAVAGGDGCVYATEDGGLSWQVALEGLPEVRGVMVT
ncbi:MAG TPA: hypothetical protein VFG30_23770 [Polyangiales bacterium]|nr:hypothetical protein [Polyangiales bacterium]